MQIKKNSSAYTFESIKFNEYLEKHGYSKPKYMDVPKNYDGFYTDYNIYVMKSNNFVKPIAIIPYSKTR